MLTTPIKKTYADYLQLPEETRCELIDGELLMSPSPTTFHQRVLPWLCDALSAYIRKHNLGEIFFAPLDVLLSEYDVVQPDLLFVSNARKEIIRENNIDGPPDLVVEIVSPTSRERDQFIKKALYARYGIREYWLVDLEKRCIQVFNLRGNEYHLIGIYFDNDILSTPLLYSLQLSVTEIFQ